MLKPVSILIALITLGVATTPALAHGGCGGHGGGHCGGGGHGGGGGYRGGWGNYQEYRDPNLWNGDAYVAEADKMQMYSNYHGAVNGTNLGNYYAAQNVPPTAGYNSAWHNSVPGQVYSGPAFIGPEHYDTVVQTYSWGNN